MEASKLRDLASSLFWIEGWTGLALTIYLAHLKESQEMKVPIFDIMKTRKIRKVEVLKRTLFTECANKDGPSLHYHATHPPQLDCTKGGKKSGLYSCTWLYFPFVLSSKSLKKKEEARVDCSQCNGPFPGNEKKMALAFYINTIGYV